MQLLLAANLPPSQVCAVFGDDLLEDEALLPIYRVLLGLPDPEDPGRTAIKPLECVGTTEEARQSLLRAADRHAEPADVSCHGTAGIYLACILPRVATMSTSRELLLLASELHP